MIKIGGRGIHVVSTIRREYEKYCCQAEICRKPSRARKMAELLAERSLDR